MFCPYPTTPLPLSTSSFESLDAVARGLHVTTVSLVQQILDRWLVDRAAAEGGASEAAPTILAFLAANTEAAPLGMVSAVDIYATYSGWCVARGAVPESRNALGRALRVAGFIPRRAAGGRRMWVGLRLVEGLLPHVEAPVADELPASNAVAHFIAARCVKSSLSVVQSATLYAAWVAYAKEAGEPPLSHRAFSLAVKAAGVESRRVRGQRSWVGIALRDVAPHPA